MHINVMEKKGSESAARSGGEVNAVTIRRIRPRGAEWPRRASVRPLFISDNTQKYFSGHKAQSFFGKGRGRERYFVWSPC